MGQSRAGGQEVTTPSRLLMLLPTDRFLSEATVMRLAGLPRTRVIATAQILSDLRCVEVSHVQHTGIGRVMRIYRRIA